MESSKYRPRRLVGVVFVLVVIGVVAFKATTTATVDVHAPTTTVVTQAQESTRASWPTPSASPSPTWSYLPEITGVGTPTQAQNALGHMAQIWFTNRYSTDGTPLAWDQIDRKLDALATPGLRVSLSEQPDKQTVGVGIDSHVLWLGFDRTDDPATPGIWNGTVTVSLHGRDVTVTARAVATDGTWMIDRWEVTQ